MPIFSKMFYQMFPHFLKMGKHGEKKKKTKIINQDSKPNDYDNQGDNI